MSVPALTVRQVVDVALAVPVDTVFSYTLPPAIEKKTEPGMRVRVPFRNREAVGYVVAVESRETERPLKPVAAVLDEKPVLSPEILLLARQISDYYGSSWGEAIENALPKWVKYGKKADRALKVSEAETPYIAGPVPLPPDLTAEQTGAFDIISARLEERCPKPLLVHGVTGSGKSELYIRTIRAALKKNRSAICLVPEITLTEQLQHFFESQFGEQLEILHSKQSEGERFRAWNRLEKGKTRIVLGPRSAVFAPVQKLGVIIVDEEHENSYKQETTPRYHARQVARWRAANENALLIMGSATPSLEAMAAVSVGDFDLITLTRRIDNRPMPEVRVIDLKDQMAEQKRFVMFSRHLIREIEHNLSQGEGTLLLLNRRGYSTRIHCPECGGVETCESCQVALTFHQEDGQLLCHYCNFHKPLPDKCLDCGRPLLRFSGFGTEKVESELARWFPQARVARLDTDTIRRKGSHEKILSHFRGHKLDILIGTQMIAKGFDFPHVTLVGVILADVGLMLPDFRSAERTFQLITQVAGRAGRGSKPGRVLVQTFSPRHPSIEFARTHDYGSFFKHESSERMKLGYPPYQQLINIILRSKDENKVYKTARALQEALAGTLDSERPKPELIGPAPLPFYKLRGHYRWHLMIKIKEDNPGLNRAIIRQVSRLRKPAAVQTAVDIDPVNIL